MYTIITIARDANGSRRTDSYLTDDELILFKTLDEATGYALKATTDELDTLTKDCPKDKMFVFEDGGDELGSYIRILCVWKEPFFQETVTTRYIRKLKEI